MSVGGLNYCLKALIDKGFIKMGNFQKSKNKFKYQTFAASLLHKFVNGHLVNQR
jgi:hypothetical protein